MSTNPRPLSTALATYDHTRALKSGSVVVPGYQLDFVEVTPIIAAFRRMIRTLEFDVCEMAPTTYLTALEAGVPIIAIPVFLMRRFHHGDIVCRPGSGIERPKDLEGRRVGVRAYTVSTGVWARALLQSEYGVDPDKVTWVVDDEEHVESFKLPPNVEKAEPGDSIVAMFHSGRIDAALTGPAGLGRSGAPGAGWGVAGGGWDDNNEKKQDFYQLFDNSAKVEAESYRTTKVYPLHALVAIKTEVVAKYPDLPARLIAALEESKRPFIEALRRGDAESPDLVRYGGLLEVVGPDPLPFGIEANMPSIDALLDAAVNQHILHSRPTIEQIFTG
ncbi:MAG: ABC transporter substrate-binding protein [Actinomycetota bacterium]|nr:ABC transporter substrate-binding protein [Actinomycetota bacterium]